MRGSPPYAFEQHEWQLTHRYLSTAWLTRSFSGIPDESCKITP